MEEMDREDQAFRKLLQRATAPEPQAGSELRLLQRISATAVAAGSNVVPLRRSPSPPRLAMVALPLAASLVLGVLIGSDALIDRFLPESVASLILPAGIDLEWPAPLGDADSLDGDLA
jgi:hypothetical protein